MSSSPSDAPGWAPFGGGATLGGEGLEGGEVVRDEEHPEGARITLERGGPAAPFVITCGVYGWMVHSRFFSTADEAEGEYAAMRPELEALARVVHREDDPELELRSAELAARIAGFVDRFP